MEELVVLLIDGENNSDYVIFDKNLNFEGTEKGIEKLIHFVDKNNQILPASNFENLKRKNLWKKYFHI